MKSWDVTAPALYVHGHRNGERGSTSYKGSNTGTFELLGGGGYAQCPSINALHQGYQTQIDSGPKFNSEVKSRASSIFIEKLTATDL